MKKQTGFALLDLFLAVILIATVSAGVYEMLSAYNDKAKIQTVESDMINIAQSYAPMLNQTAIEESGYSIFGSNAGSISTAFLKSVPIPDSRISTPSYQNNIPYSYVLTKLRVNGEQPVIGYEVANVAGDESNPPMKYLIAGITVNYSQAVQLIQDLNSSFSVFWGKGSVPFNETQPATTLPDRDADSSQVYSLFFVTPNTDDPNISDCSTPSLRTPQ